MIACECEFKFEEERDIATPWSVSALLQNTACTRRNTQKHRAYRNTRIHVLSSASESAASDTRRARPLEVDTSRGSFRGQDEGKRSLGAERPDRRDRDTGKERPGDISSGR